MTPLLLLHGAIGSANHFNPLIKYLPSFDLHAINFYGHGGEPGNKPFSIEEFAEQVALFISDKNMTAVNIFGYSMGGYVAMYMARHLNIKIEKIITLGTKFQWNEAIAEKECKMLQPEIIEQKIPAFAQSLSELHGQTKWKSVLHKTAEMLRQMGKQNPLQTEDYSSINIPSLIMLGDRDKMVTREETIATFQFLPNAQLAILPATSHPLEQADSSLLAYHIQRFLS
jgi:pimeloyl-ACP methyl ester carboxylesterase